MYVPWKLSGNSTSGKHLVVFLAEIICIGKKSPVTLTANVAFPLFISTLIETFLAPLKLNVYFSGRKGVSDHAKKGCLIKVYNEFAWYVLIIGKSYDGLLKGKSFFR